MASDVMAYRSAIDARLGHARHVLERFHVIRWFSAGLTQARRDIQRRRPPGAKPVFEPEVSRARFALLCRADTLTDADRARLEGLREGSRASKPLHLNGGVCADLSRGGQSRSFRAGKSHLLR